MEVERPSRAFRLLCLERAVLAAHRRYGIPIDQGAQEFFDGEVDCLFRCFLMAARVAPESSFRTIGLRQIAARCAVKHGAQVTERRMSEYLGHRSEEILSGGA